MSRATSTLIKGGMVLDGLGGPVRIADVLISQDEIVDVGPTIDALDAEVIDAAGLIVSPGFIDLHSHSDFTLLVDPRAVSSVTQGVTTEIVGNCGYGCGPIGSPDLAREVIYGYRTEPSITWRDIGGYLDAVDEAKPAVNVATLVPNGQLRLTTVGLAERAANPDELRAMEKLLDEGLEQGAFGYSTGLEYATERGASEHEITCLCRRLKRTDGLYATHTRNRDEDAVAAVAEAVRTAENAGVRLQLSHIVPRGGREDTERAIDLVVRSQAAGSGAAFDMHTRLFGTTYLKVLIPGWAFEGGREALVRRLKSPEDRARMTQSRNLIVALGDWSRVVLLDNPALPQYSRKNFAEIGRMRGQSPLDAAYDLLLEEIDYLHRPMVILHSYSEDLLMLAYGNRICGVGSDATALAPDGPLSGSTFHGAYTWASWFWRRVVRESGLLSPEEAVRRLTSSAAERIGLQRRGAIRRGYFADVIAFDGAMFGETGTTFEPNQTATGMRHVLVNGVVSMRDGKLQEARGGRALRKP